jgi:flagellar motor switch protein FliN/FliY
MVEDTQLALVGLEKPEGEGNAKTGPWITRMEQHEAWPTLSRMRVMLTVRIALDRIKVRDLLQLQLGQVLESGWSHTNDVSLTAGEVRLAWSEFEVSGQRIGVRLTQLA